MTKTGLKDTVGGFSVSLFGLKILDVFYKQLPLNENENNSDGKLNDIHYKRTVKKLHYTHCKILFFFY